MVVFAGFFLETSLLNSILERLPLHQPQDTYKAVLRVYGFVDEAAATGYYTTTYSVLNMGNATAQNVPRAFSDNVSLVQLFFTPREPSLVALKDEVLKELLLSVKDCIALKNWVGNNIQYHHDDAVHGMSDYWQFGKEILAMRTDDCEDFSILLCSLLSAAEYYPNGRLHIHRQKPKRIPRVG